MISVCLICSSIPVSLLAQRSIIVCTLAGLMGQSNRSAKISAVLPSGCNCWQHRYTATAPTSAPYWIGAFTSCGKGATVTVEQRGQHLLSGWCSVTSRRFSGRLITCRLSCLRLSTSLKTLWQYSQHVLFSVIVTSKGTSHRG